MEKKKILFLTCSSPNLISSNYRKEYGISSFPLIKKKSIIIKILLFIGYYLYTPVLYLTYDKWKKNLSNYDCIILDTRRPAKYAVKMFSKKNKRVIMFYWNIISKKELSPSFLKHYTNEIYTFDRNDSLKYNIGFNDTCIYDKILDKYNANIKQNIAYYLGANKPGRNEMLEYLYKDLSMLNIKCDFNLVNAPNSKFNSCALEYTKYLQVMSKSFIVVEIVLDGQTGLTLRTLEAMYYRKKLITNNFSIKTYPFYNPSWIYIIGESRNIESFILCKSSYKDEITDFYCFQTWLERLIGEKVY